MDLYEKLASHEAVENCFPKFITRVNGVNTVLANVVDGVVYLTDEGEKFTAKLGVTAEKQPRTRKTKATVVEPAVAEQPSESADMEFGSDLNFDE